MKFSKPERADLVINMTLAEMFLLLMFVLWYGHTSVPDPAAHLKEELARLKMENDSLKKELIIAENEISDLKWRLEWWHRTFPVVVEGSSVDSAHKAAGRSHAKCGENNVLIHARVIKGQISIRLVLDCQELSGFLLESGRTQPSLGVQITNSKVIQAFLDGVRDYYSSLAAEGNECRFDYRLTYESKEDYYDGRELFERYFYPAGLSRSANRF